MLDELLEQTTNTIGDIEYVPGLPPVATDTMIPNFVRGVEELENVHATESDPEIVGLHSNAKMTKHLATHDNVLRNVRSMEQQEVASAPTEFLAARRLPSAVPLLSLHANSPRAPRPPQHHLLSCSMLPPRGTGQHSFPSVFSIPTRVSSCPPWPFHTISLASRATNLLRSIPSCAFSSLAFAAVPRSLRPLYPPPFGPPPLAPHRSGLDS